MSAGTLTLTNNSAAVAGNGTTFTTEVAAGDFIVVNVGGIPYTLPVKSVESGTALTLVSNFTGPTQSGSAWSAVPRLALNMVTAALVAQSAEALRGLNSDKQNWQQVFSGTGNITVRLPDGSSYTGPAWGSITTALSEKADKTALGDYAKKGSNNDITSLSGLTTALSVKQGGTGGDNPWDSAGNLKTIRSMTRRFVNGDFPTDVQWRNSTGFITGQAELTPTGAWIDISSFDNNARMQLVGFYSNHIGAAGFGYKVYNPNSNLWTSFTTVRDSSNTTIDVNGFIKTASPIVDIRGNGTFSVNGESEGCQVERLSVGVYCISGCLGLNSDIAWGGIDGGFEIPVDRNKQPRIWLDYKVNADGSVLVRTYHRVHPSAPPFAQNRIGSTDIDGVFTETVADGEPVDIPADSFVSIRVEMPEDSIWNQKQKETRDVTEKTERERQQNQQDTQ
ncbi:phage tail protein [Citrobacter braakii]|uniref:phage tail fiber protein n=1 Tax=Citrobacter braakii TaxID=57706 RepID=UPI002433DB8C|nr:phage tail protein [Citrobacter braakii]WFW23996.1 phage tail protein [Citrobacter braakii]